MPPFNIRTLNKTDSEALLAFETQNREWFESHIDPRPASFYSTQGVADHIDGYLSGFARGTWHPFVIENANDEIVGRANLKDINVSQGSAEVGYRIGQRHCAQGLATLALRHTRFLRTSWERRDRSTRCSQHTASLSLQEVRTWSSRPPPRPAPVLACRHIPGCSSVFHLER